MKSAALALSAVIVVAIVMLFGSVLHHREYTPDGMVYARYAARDAGASERQATLMVRSVYEQTPLMRVKRYRDLVEIDPSVAFARSRIFANRVLYPWVVSLFLPVAGFTVMFWIGAASFACFGIALFWALMAFGRPWIAAALSIAALLLPLTRELAASDLTDVFALLWWTVALGALLHSLREQRAGTIALLALASVLLALTRPAPYLVVLPALVLGLVRGFWWPLAASACGAAAYGITDFATHAFGLREQLRWVYVHESPQRVPFAQWYRGAVLQTLRYTAGGAVRTLVPLLAAAAMVYGWMRLHLRAEMAVLCAAAVACLAAIPFNPVPSSIPRVAVLPLVPVICAVLQAVAAAAIPAASEDRLQVRHLARASARPHPDRLL